MLKKTLLVCVGIGAGTLSFGDGVSVHLQGGASLASFEKSHGVYVSPDIENQYDTSSEDRFSPFVGVGVAYQWDQPLSLLPHLALSVGLSAYYMKNTLNGTNTPAANQAPPEVTFDGLPYTMNEASKALMWEPKFIYTAYSWQPYVVIGLGVASNQLGDYQETDTPSAVANQYPSPGKTETHFAYSFGAGAQHVLFNAKNGGSLAIALEYHYMNWGDMALSPFPGGSASQALNFGQLRTHLIDANLMWQF